MERGWKRVGDRERREREERVGGERKREGGERERRAQGTKIASLVSGGFAGVWEGRSHSHAGVVSDSS